MVNAALNPGIETIIYTHGVLRLTLKYTAYWLPSNAAILGLNLAIPFGQKQNQDFDGANIEPAEAAFTARRNPSG